jgi:adenylate kinase family enzyme
MNYISKFTFTSQTRKLRPIVLMIGAPGVGKGTYGRMLSKEFQIKEFSTGDELRKISSSSGLSPELQKIKDIMNQGII